MHCIQKETINVQHNKNPRANTEIKTFSTDKGKNQMTTWYHSPTSEYS